jgi:hypothetical protein
MARMEIMVALAFLAIIGSMGAAAFFMLRGPAAGKNKKNSMARALALRVGVSIVLFLCILLAWKLGYIQPTGIAPGR